MGTAKTWSDHYDQVRRGVENLHRQVDAVGNAVDTLSSGKELVVRVNDYALQPVIKPGDAMVFKATTYGKVRVGDFVMYRLNDGSPAIRRVVRKMIYDRFGQRFLAVVTRGQSDPTMQDVVPVVKVMARLEYVDRGGTRIKPNRLNRGIIDWLTDFGTRSVFHRFLDVVLFFVPATIRGSSRLPANINVIDPPTHSHA